MPLGLPRGLFTKENVLVVRVPREEMAEKFNLLHTRFMQNVNVKYVSACSHLPNGSLGSSPLRLKSESESSSFQTSYFTVDYDYLKTMDIPLVQGRFFSKNFSNDSTQSILLNESAVKVIGLKNPIGKKVIFPGNSAKTIIGVVKDYHFSS